MDKDMEDAFNIFMDMMGESKTATSIKKLFNASTRPTAQAIIGIVKEFDDYLPLTVRQVYYQLVAKEVIPNDLDHYQHTSRVLVKLRDNELVPWSAIEDRSRRTIEKRGFTNVSEWLKEKLAVIDPKYYGRCLVQHQDVYVEVSTEKDAISTILEDQLWIYCTRLNIVRGQSSRTIIEQMAGRFDAAIMRGQKPILLHFGDLDPSGRGIPRAIKKTFLRVHGVEVDVRTVALNPEQVREHHLPSSIEAVKEKDPNYAAWIREYGPEQTACELDALHPETLKRILKNALGGVYNIDGLLSEQGVEKEERLLIRRIKRDVQNMLSEKYPWIPW